MTLLPKSGQKEAREAFSDNYKKSFQEYISSAFSDVDYVRTSIIGCSGTVFITFRLVSSPPSFGPLSIRSSLHETKRVVVNM
jgi:hypothetical protein